MIAFNAKKLVIITEWKGKSAIPPCKLKDCGSSYENSFATT